MIRKSLNDNYKVFAANRTDISAWEPSVRLTKRLRSLITITTYSLITICRNVDLTQLNNEKYVLLIISPRFNSVENSF